MRKIKLQMRISVDGYVAGPNGEEEWQIAPDAALWNLIDELPDSADTLLLGRKMAKDFIPHFENFDPAHPKFAFAQKMVNLKKIIFTTTLEEPFGKNTTLAKGKLAYEIAKLKNEPGKDILVYGGAGLVSSLIAGGHIDEFYLIVVPIITNRGMRIFDLPGQRQQLTLISTTPYNSGVVVLHYKLNP